MPPVYARFHVLRRAGPVENDKTLCTMGTALPPRQQSGLSLISDAATICPILRDHARACESWMWSEIACEEKPPKMTVCGAPMRAHASTAVASSRRCTHIDTNAVQRFLTPNDLSTLAKRQTSDGVADRSSVRISPARFPDRRGLFLRQLSDGDPDSCGTKFSLPPTNTSQTERCSSREPFVHGLNTPLTRNSPRIFRVAIASSIEGARIGY